MGTLLPFAKAQWFDNNGDPAAGFQLFSYAAGTVNKVSLYTDADLTVPHTNPVILDAAGRATCFAAPGFLKLVLATPTDADPPLSPVWTVDEVQSIPTTSVATDIEGTAGENLLNNESVYLSDGSGGTTAGRWYKTDADFNFSAAAAGVVGFVVTDAITGGTVLVRIGGRKTDFGGLTPGAAYYVGTAAGALVSTVPTMGTSYRKMAYADTTTSMILAEKPKAQIRDRVATMVATVGNVGAGEDTLFEYIAPAGEVYLDGMSWHGKFFGATANNANAKTLSVRVIEGANNVVLIAFVLTANELGEFVLEFDILRTAATLFRYTCGARVGPANGPTSSVGDNNDITQTATFANAVTIRITGTATTNDDITLAAGTIRLLD